VLLITIKKIIDVFVGLLSNVNDLWVLCQFGLHKKVEYNGLFEIEKASQNGFAPSFLGDKGYPLISWIITPYKKKGQHFVLELLQNRKHKRNHYVVENVFSNLKNPFKNYCQDLIYTCLFCQMFLLAMNHHLGWFLGFSV
jgi:hypothetical protein